jgi:hypothetical protein
MSKSYDGIDDSLRRWILRQPVVFVATAPLSGNGHVNVSPKGGQGTVVVLDSDTVAYLDYTGSGVETIAHVRENGRITLMWCAFNGPPKVLRVHGRGSVVVPGDPTWDALASCFGADVEAPGVRAIIVVHADRISDSCGYGVPLMEWQEDRPVLDLWAAKKGRDGVERYQRERNAESIDGLPGI